MLTDLLKRSDKATASVTVGGRMAGEAENNNRQFIDAIRRKTQPESNFADALQTMAAAELILAQALREGG